MVLEFGSKVKKVLLRVTDMETVELFGSTGDGIVNFHNVPL